MRFSLNYRLLALLVVGTLAAAGSVYLIHEYQVRRTAGVLLSRAEKVGREGKKQEELDLLKRYLAHRPADIDALEKYGLILAGDDAGESRVRAMETLERVLARDPSRLNARKKAADLAWKLGQVEAARAHYEFLESSTPGGDAYSEEGLGRCEERVKRYPEAVSWLEKAIKRDSSMIDAYARLARLLRGRMKKPDLADLVMDAREIKTGLIAENPESARAYLGRALYRREFAIPGGEEDLKKALALAPDEADVLMASAQVSPTDQAIRLLEHGIEVHPDDPRFYEALAMTEVLAGRRDRAIDELGKGLRRLPENQDLRWMLTELNIDAGRRDEAAAEIKKLRNPNYPGAPADFLEARLLLDARQWTEAARRLARTAPELELLPGSSGTSKRAFLMLARCHQELGNPDMRYAAARRAVALEVADPLLAVAARKELASALAGLGKLDEAAEEYRTALRMPGASAGLRVELCQVLVAKNLRLPPQQRRWDEVERVLNESEASLPGLVNLAILRAEILVAQEHLDAAGDRLKQAEVGHPDSVGLQVALAALAERRGRPEEALTILEGARKRLGERPELLSALIRYWSSKPGEAGSRALAGLADAAGSVADESDRRSLLETLSNGFDRAGDAGKSAAIRDRLVAEQPDHLGLRLEQLDSALKNGDFARAGRVLDEVRRIEGPEGSLWRFGRSQMLILAARKSRDDKGLAEARVLLAEARERRPRWARATLATAELDDMRGDLGSALRGYLAALEDGERDPGILRRAVQLLYQRGQFAQADALIRRAQQEGPLSPELGRLAADVALQARDDDRAIEIARLTVAGRPDSAADQTWLGQLLFAASRKAEERGQADDARVKLRAEAERVLARGVELAPTDPNAQVALVQALAAWNRDADAREAIRKAEASLKGPVGELALARCLESVGRPDEAEARYRAMLQARPDDAAALQAASIAALRGGKVRDAEPLLRRLIALQNKTPREAAWARRILALALTVENRGGSSKARALLGLDDDPASGSAEPEGRANLSADDLRARAQVLARQPGRSSHRKALSMIEALTARDEATPADLFLRAQILASEGDWKRAGAAAQQLLAEEPSNPTLLEFLARGQIASGKPDEATPWLDELARLRPQAPLITELKARILFASGKAPEAVALLDNLERKDPTLGLAVAGLLEEAKQADAAEALLRRLTKEGTPQETRVNASLALAGLLGRQSRHAETIGICEKLWADPSVLPSRISSVALAALYTGHPDEAILRRVEAGITTALAQKPGDTVLRFDSANLAILRNRYAEAESILRAIHKNEPDRGSPLNNLAWMLALRGDVGPEPLSLIDQAIALDGRAPHLLDTRGLVLMLRGQPDRAVGELEESIAVVPTPIRYLHLALALRKASRPAEAAEALGKARTSGLRPSDVHPLERPAYLDIVAAFPEK